MYFSYTTLVKILNILPHLNNVLIFKVFQYRCLIYNLKKVFVLPLKTKTRVFSHFVDILNNVCKDTRNNNVIILNNSAFRIYSSNLMFMLKRSSNAPKRIVSLCSIMLNQCKIGYFVFGYIDLKYLLGWTQIGCIHISPILFLSFFTQ